MPKPCAQSQKRGMIRFSQPQQLQTAQACSLKLPPGLLASVEIAVCWTYDRVMPKARSNSVENLVNDAAILPGCSASVAIMRSATCGL